jgi:hypothetical protein
MTLTCKNCGYINTIADDTSVVCPNCGTFYQTASYEDAPTGETVPTALMPPPAITAPPGPYAYPAAPFPPVAAPAPRVTKRDSRSLLLGIAAGAGVAAVIAIIILIFAGRPSTPVAVAATATPAPTATKVGVTLLTYRDPNGQFTIKYPSTWPPMTTSVTLGGQQISATRFATTTGNEGFIVLVSPNLSLSDISSLIAQVGKGRGQGYQAVGTPTAIMMTSGAWTAQAGSFTVNGKTLGIQGWLLQKGTQSYLVVGYGPAKDFGQLQYKEFRVLINSFTTAGA